MFCVQHTPLMLACTKGKPEVVKVLLLHGADVKLTEGKEEQAGQEEKEQETLNSLELAIENSRRYMYIYIHVLMKEGRSKQGQTNNKAKQHSTPKALTFPKKNELPQVGLEPTTLYTLDRALYH